MGLTFFNYVAGLLFDTRLHASGDELCVEYLQRFGLSSAATLLKRDRQFAQRLCLMLFRRMLNEGGDFADWTRLARWCYANRDKVRFSKSDQRSDFTAAIGRYIRLADDIGELCDAFRDFGADHARPVIVARGVVWGRLVVLLLIQKRSHLPPERVEHLARWIISHPGKVKLDGIESAVIDWTGTFPGWLRGSRWKSFLSDWRAEHPPFCPDHNLPPLDPDEDDELVRALLGRDEMLRRRELRELAENEKSARLKERSRRWLGGGAWGE